jgi:hypothetical protein
MKITIAAKLRPFSHTPGASCIIPGTCSVLQAFPTLLRIDESEIPLALTGPVENFTLLQDLEKHCVFVFGKAKEGYFRLRIEAHDAGYEIRAEKGPLESISVAEEVRFVPQKSLERLSLGSHKAQDWDLVQRRSELKEILPTLFYLGQKVPRISLQPLSGTAQLLKFPAERKELAGALLAFFKAGFRSILVPRLFDDQYQGLCPDEGGSGNPFFLLQEGVNQIRSLFFRQNDRRIAFLPNLPTPFDSGRLIGIQALGIGAIDFEWSKKTLRRVQICASTSGEVLLDLPKEIKTYRVQKKGKQKGSEPLLLEAGKSYLLDRFEK